jgi:hypothetical protein
MPAAFSRATCGPPEGKLCRCMYLCPLGHQPPRENGQREQGLVVPETAEAVRYAEERGWILVRDGHSVCLTEADRRLMDQ